MHQSKKGNEWHWHEAAHRRRQSDRPDPQRDVTAGHVHDGQELPNLLHGGASSTATVPTGERISGTTQDIAPRAKDFTNKRAAGTGP
jgi:IS5 family transposase